MLKLPEKSYELVKQTLEIVGFSGDELSQELEEFEKDLAVEFAQAAIRKLPEQERPEVIKLTNANDKESVAKLHKKLQSWFNEKEYVELLQKTADRMFEEMLKFLYSKANAEQRQKFEEVFDEKALRD